MSDPGEKPSSKMAGRLAQRLRDLKMGSPRPEEVGIDERTHLLRAERTLFRSLRGVDNPDACDASGVTEEQDR